MKTSEQIKSFNKVQEYNGWTNKPTWAVALWINNDQGLQETVFEAARNNDKDNPYLLAGWLQDFFTDELYPDFPTSMYSDLLNWSLAYVDWDSLAEHFIEDAKEIS